MPGPPKKYPKRIKVSMRDDQVEAIAAEAEKKELAEAEVIRLCIDRQLKLGGRKKKQTADERRESLAKHWKKEIGEAWDEYLKGREVWWRKNRDRNPPGEPKDTKERRQARAVSCESHGPQNTILAGRGVWLDPFFTEKGLTSPEYVWGSKGKNVMRFAQRTIEVRMGYWRADDEG